MHVTRNRSSEKTCLSILFLTVLLITVSHSALGEVPISLELDRPGKISMSIYDQESRMIRRLIVGEDKASGRHDVVWDGLNEKGEPVEPGDYKWRLVNSPGIKAEFLTLLGTSDGYWHWPGAHEGPGSIEVVGDTAIMTANLVEGSPQWIAWDLNSGEVKWHQKPASGFGWIADIAAGSDYIYASGFGRGRGELLIIDHDGKWLPSWSTWQRKILTWLPVAQFDLAGEGNAKSFLTGVGLHTFDQRNGYGWVDTEGIERVALGDRSGHASTTRRSATFRIEMPEGNPYQAQASIGNPTDQPRSINVRIHGDRRQASTETVTLQPGETKLITSRRGREHIQVTVRNPEGEPVGWALLNVRVNALPTQIAARKDRLVIALRNKFLVWLDPMQGKQIDKRPFMVFHRPVETKRLKLEIDKEINDVEILPDERVVVLTDDRLAEVREDGKVRTLIDGLDHAARAKADEATGELFIVEHGDCQQIKVFTPELKLRATFGRKGGRLQGKYEPHDFLEVDDIAGDGNGGFVIVEGHPAPRRTAHFNSKGDLIREWYGAQTFFVHSWHDPQQPDHIWFDNGHGWVTEAIVDYENGSWKPYATYKLGAGERGESGKLDIRVQHTGYAGFHLRWHDGKRYLCKSGTPTVLRVEEENHRVVPVAHAYRIAQNQYVLKEDRVPTWVTTYQEVKKHKYLTVMWADLNGDGEPQAEESRLSKGTFSGSDSWVDDDLTYYTAAGDVIKCEWISGVPIYQSPEEATRQEAPVNWRDVEGNFYYQYHKNHMNIHAYGWPSNMVAQDVGLQKWAPDGKTLLFNVGNKAVTWPRSHQEGQLHFPVKIAGVVSNAVGVCERVGMPVKFWTTDGLYIGHLFNRRGEGPESAYHWWRVDPSKSDSFGRSGNQALLQYDMAAGGRLVEHNAEIYFFGAGWNNVPVYRVSGLDEVKRQAGNIAIAGRASAPALEGTGLTARYFRGEDTSGEPIAERIEPQVHLGEFGNYSKKGGKPNTWPEAVAAADTSAFTVRLSGQLEPRLTDTYTLLIYGGPADVYVDGEKVLDSSQRPAFKSGPRFRSRPIRLVAGEKVALRIEAQRTVKQPLYLCWEAEAISAEVIPGACLYPK